ncbi:MAG: GTP cyclohydrolase II [Alphaproteobacteria bacterium]
MSLRTPNAAPSAARADADAPDALIAVDRALADLRRGRLIVVMDEAGTLLVQAAEAVTPHSLARLAQLGDGPALLALTGRRADALGLAGIEGVKVAALEIADGTPAQTVRDIADPAADITFRLPPLHALPPALTPCAAAAVHLTKLARLLPTALIAPLAAKDAAEVIEREDLLAVSAADVADYEQRAARSLKPVSQARVPLFDAENARIVAYRPSDGGIEHLAIVIGEPKADQPVLIRLHSECFTGDLLGSLRCDCGDQLRGAIAAISEAGSGVLLYLAQEGRGIGLVNKLRAYQLQDGGADTIDANEQLGFDADERLYLPAAQMLRDMGFSRVRLLTNNPEKVAALQACGIEVVERVPHAFPATAHNKAYLETKAKRSGHLF